MMRSTAAFAVALSLMLPLAAPAKSGSMQHRTGEDFQSLIAKGERPEIAACMAASIDFIRHNRSFTAIRWDEDASDHAHVRESENGPQLTRFVRFTAELRPRDAGFFSEKWRRADFSCEQHEDGATDVHMTLK